jgi:hypothetical protein
MDMTAAVERRQRQLVNDELHALGNYHDGLALTEIDAILTKHGFNEMEPAIYCGRDGRVNEQVGKRTWLSLSWHKMEVTGRYEVVAYVS